MTTSPELFEVIKNGPLQPGEVLLTVKGKTFRVHITHMNMEMDYGSGIPEFTLQICTFENIHELATALLPDKG